MNSKRSFICDEKKESLLFSGKLVFLGNANSLGLVANLETIVKIIHYFSYE